MTRKRPNCSKLSFGHERATKPHFGFARRSVLYFTDSSWLYFTRACGTLKSMPLVTVGIRVLRASTSFCDQRVMLSAVCTQFCLR